MANWVWVQPSEAVVDETVEYMMRPRSCYLAFPKASISF